MKRSSASTAPTIAELVFRERVEILSQPRIETLVATLIVGALLTLMLARAHQWPLALIWYAGLSLLHIGSRLVIAPATMDTMLRDNPSRWLQCYIALAAAIGLYWSLSLAWLVDADDLLTHSFMAWALSGIAIGSITVHAYHLPTMLVFLGCLLLPFTLRTLWLGDFSHVFLGSGSLLLCLFLALFGRYHARALERALRLGHENYQLIAQLQVQREAAVQLQEQAEQASLSKSRFFAAASHDLRQPLQALSLYALVLADSDLPPSQHQTSLRIREAVNVLEDLFKGVLDISRIEAGNLELIHEPVCVQELMNNALLLFSGEALDKDIGLKAIASSLWVLGDRLALQRTVSNLVANAVRYTHSGRVVLGVRRKRGMLHLQVIDTGPGIDPAYQARIFDEFFRLPDVKGHGFGLGLATVKRLCDAAGYPLGFASAPGKGSTFWIELPLCPDTE